MRILNLEDNAFKHHNIAKTLKNAFPNRVTVDWERDLASGLEKIEEQLQADEPYELIITDMWYPAHAGSGDSQSGEVLIREVADMDVKIPIILCSSVNYRYPEILGAVHYAEDSDWENELLALVRSLF